MTDCICPSCKDDFELEVVQADSAYVIDEVLIRCPFCDTALEIVKIEDDVAHLEIAKSRVIRSKRKTIDK